MTQLTASGALPGQGGSVGQAPAVRLTDVHKAFGTVRAVDGIDLAVAPGEIVAFLGPNGAGKTTSIDMMLGLSRPSAGSVEVFGMDPSEAVRCGLVAAVMQSGGLPKDLTVAETVRLVSALFTASRPADEVLQRAGITHLADRLVGRCSGGEQQRLRFAMALLPDPQLLILDEPTTGMDVEGRRGFWSAIRTDANRGRTVLFATHYLDEADAYADRVVLVRRGRVVADGTAAEIRAMASGRTVRATLPGATRDQLLAVPGAESAEVSGDTVRIHGRDTDAVARYLLTQTAARDVEIASRNLEDAFLALTVDDDPTGPVAAR